MKIGVPKEIKNHEYRVGLKPEFVRELVNHGHQVQVQTLAGSGVGATVLRLAEAIAVVGCHFEQRVLFHFLLDELGELDMRHLQQLNRLHQLRCHHQRLALSDL